MLAIMVMACCNGSSKRRIPNTQKPQFIQSFERPSDTEVKLINGHYYFLYERKSVYAPLTKRKKKKSGALLGTITEDGRQDTGRHQG